MGQLHLADMKTYPQLKEVNWSRIPICFSRIHHHVCTKIKSPVGPCGRNTNADRFLWGQDSSDGCLWLEDLPTDLLNILWTASTPPFPHLFTCNQLCIAICQLSCFVRLLLWLSLTTISPATVLACLILSCTLPRQRRRLWINSPHLPSSSLTFVFTSFISPKSVLVWQRTSIGLLFSILNHFLGDFIPSCGYIHHTCVGNSFSLSMEI